MRSFIKSHRKTDSTVSSTLESPLLENNHATSTHGHSNSATLISPPDDYYPPVSYSNRSSTTPIPSPKIQQHPQFTPPQANHSNSSSISSPKKLLTPIKNLFASSSHSKSTVATPSSSENLSNCINGISPKESKVKFLKHKRRESHISITNELTKLPKEPLNSLYDNKTYTKLTSFEHTKTKSSKHRSSTIETSKQNSQSNERRPSSTTSESNNRSEHFADSNQRKSLLDPSTTTSGLGPPISLSQTPSYASSNTSIAESESKFNTKTVLLDEIQLLENDKTTKKKQTSERMVDFEFPSKEIYETQNKKEQHQQSFYDQDEDNKDDDDNDDDDDDDNSSQFSFVHDMKGGRNTSVKYYKTKNSKNTNNDEGLLNTFNELDLGYEVDEFSDYDYENNGGDLDDEYDDFGGFEEDDEDENYNKYFGSDLEDTNDDEGIFHRSSVDNQSPERNVITPDLENKTAPELTNTREKLGESLLPIDSDRPNKRNKFNGSFHLSIVGPKTQSPKPSPTKSGFEEDILENYLDKSDRSSTNSDDSSLDQGDFDTCNFELFALNSPIINGLTIGNNLRHRGGRDRDFINTNRLIIHRKPIDFYDDNSNVSGFHLNNKERSKLYLHAFHGSIDDGFNKAMDEKVKQFDEFTTKLTNTSEHIKENIGLGITTATEANQEKLRLAYAGSISTNDSATSRLTAPTSDMVSSSTETSTIPINNASKLNIADTASFRQSVNDMMALLGSLESKQAKAEDENFLKKANNSNTQRNSIIDMMGILGKLEDDINKQTGSTEKAKLEVRNSIVGMMDLLANLESKELNTGAGKTNANNKEESKKLRSSVAGMMDLLANLENTTTTNDKPKQSNRKSVVDMMSTLSALQEPPVIENNANLNMQANTAKSLEHEPKRKASFKRYSWFNSQESLSIKGKLQVKECDPTDDNDKYNTSLDQDLLDEINQIPDDFDFDQKPPETEKYKRLSQERSGFYRSNSYNRKPKKTVISNQFLSNKIETLNKTVTFYKSSSPSSSIFDSRSRSVSRGPSTRSMNSFASVSEEVNEEDENLEENEGGGDENYSELIKEVNGDTNFRFQVTPSSYSSKDLRTIKEVTNSPNPNK